MKRSILLLLLFSLFFSVDSFSTHAAGMDISYQCVSSGSPGTPTTTLIGNGSISVNIQTVSWADECYWTIKNSSGVVVAQGGQGSVYTNNNTYFTIYCLPQGTYTFNWYDTYGDGWNGGSYTVSSTSGSTLTNGSPSTGSSGSTTFTVSEPCSNIYQTTYSGGTPDTYQITVKFYRDCDGISAPGSMSLNYSSVSCATNASINLNQVGSGVIITPICPTMNSTCTGGPVIGIEEYTYVGTISISKCADWILSVEECCRNNAINTINSPGNEELRIEATLNNSLYCNNSPIFSQPPVPYICANTLYCYNNGAIDTDGDSLVYSLITPLTSSGTVVYNILPIVYSANSPVGGITTFNSVTGNLCMNPPSPLTSVVAIRVQEYRNGILIGSIIRDIQINVLNCNEPPPYLTGIDTLASVDSDPTGGIASYNFCTDGSSSILFNINALTTSTITNLTMNWNNSIPNAYFNISANGTQNPQATFSWIPTIADVANSPFFFVVTVFDDACPLMGSFSYSYQINLTNSSGSFVSTDVSCFGLQDGTVDLSVLGGSPPYNFFWWDSVSGFTANTEDLINLDAGDYYCFIVDSLGDTLGCGVEPIHVTITNPQELIVSSVFSDVSCFGVNDGFIELTISGGITPNNVSWLSNNGNVYNNEDIYLLPPDIYTATITDANGCGPITETILITEPAEITLFGTSYDNSCFNSNDGSIDLVASGNNLIFNWTGPSLFSSNQQDISNLTAGTYTVTITDINSCVGPSASYLVNEPSDIIVNYLTNNVSCFDGNDGFIDLSITGGAGNYITIWTGVNGYFNISEDIFTLSASDYSYAITDANGCSPSVNNSPITITEPSGIQLSSVVTNETCYGDEDGSIDMTLIGTSSYIYSWVGPSLFSSTNLDISSLKAGTYNLQITDLNNCVVLHSETINIGNIIQVDTFINNISCNGYSDGNIVLLTPNSITPTFSWIGPSSFNSTSNQILNLEAGNYIAIVNDETNCPTQIDLSISEPQTLSFVSLLTDESCDGYQDGQIEIFVSGGTPNYSYVWNNGNTTSTNTNLLHGEYILNVVDDNNCIITDTFQVNLFLFDTIRQITDVSCFGGSDGFVDLEIIGGNPPFTYNWNPAGSTQDLINVLSGVYTVNITDLTNCTIVRDVIVTEPQQLSAVTNITNVLCYGDSTGSVFTVIGGGVLPYLLDWGSSDTSAMWSGFHVFTVIDDNGCKFTDSVNIQQNDSMQITSTITEVQCYGDFNGSLEIQVAQGTGTPPYSYLWNGPNNYSSINEDIYNLESGNYSIIVTDANMCSQFLHFFIDQPQQISQTTTINTSNYSGYNVRCKGENSAWVEISVSGGYPPFAYLWSNGDVADSIFNLYSGTYSLEITDNLGCTEDLSINLNEPSTYVTADVIGTSDYNGYNISCFGLNDGSVFAESINGIPPYTYLWNNNNVKDSLTSIYAGYYEVFVYDKNLCLAIDSVTLSEPSELFFDLFSYPDTCNKSVGKAEFIASGGVPNYSALWSDSSTTNIINHFTEGTYSIEVSDANSCKKSDLFSINNLEGPIADFEAYPYHKRLLDQKNKPFYFVDLSNTFSDSVKYWTWSFGDGFFDYDSLVSHIYNDPGIYTVKLEIITFSNCIDTISKDVLIDEYSFYIPNTFIPSSSEFENRILKGYGIGVQEYELKIFSRWGELIFKSNNLDVGWDGTYQFGSNNSSNNDLCPVGVYTYTVFIENIYGEIFEYQGQVKLLR